MYSGLPTFLLLVGGIIASYYLLLFFVFRKKLVTLFGKGNEQHSRLQHVTSADFPHQLIDRPIVSFEQEEVISLGEKKKDDEVDIEIVEDEESLLLKAAEIVVEKIQEVVNHIATHPPNPVEVYTKIKAIVSPYTIFHNTEYFDAINSFVAITVERDCGIQFSKKELLDLWT